MNSPRWAEYNQLRLKAESAANGLQTLLLTAQVSWSSWMVLPLMLDWSQATNRAYETEEEAMQTAYGLTAECPVSPSRGAELANAMLTPGMLTCLCLWMLPGRKLYECNTLLRLAVVTRGQGDKVHCLHS